MEQAERQPGQDNMRVRAHHGTFTQLPNVLLDTCDLADEALMLFSRLLRLVGHKGGIFYGSARKMAIAVQVKRDKACRNLKVLEIAGLVTTTAESAQEAATIILNTDDLWELNIAYTNGIEVPRWTKLQEVLAGVRKIGHSEASQKSVTVSEKSDKVTQISVKRVAKIGHGVRSLERKVPPNTINTINTEKERKTTPPSLPTPQPDSLSPEKSSSLLDQLTDEQSDCWTRCQALTGAQNLTQKAYESVVTLSSKVTTMADLQSLYDFATDRGEEIAKAAGRKATLPNVGTMAHFLPEWEKVQARKQQEKEQEQATHGHVPGSGSMTNWTQARLAGKEPPINYDPLPTVKPASGLSQVGNISAGLQERIRQARERRNISSQSVVPKG